MVIWGSRYFCLQHTLRPEKKTLGIPGSSINEWDSFRWQTYAVDLQGNGTFESHVPNLDMATVGVSNGFKSMEIQGFNQDCPRDHLDQRWIRPLGVAPPTHQKLHLRVAWLFVKNVCKNSALAAELCWNYCFHLFKSWLLETEWIVCFCTDLPFVFGLCSLCSWEWCWPTAKFRLGQEVRRIKNCIFSTSMLAYVGFVSGWLTLQKDLVCLRV